MKTLTQTIYRSYKQKIDRKITKVVHDIPTWVFSESSGGLLKTPCPVCNKEMRLEVGHGRYIETCSVIQLNDSESMPIHTCCYSGIADID